MGPHRGEAQERDGDYFGTVLNRAAVADLEASDLGSHRLKDLSDPQQLVQVVAQGLESEFAPLRTVNAVPGSLPVELTSFIGRDAQVQELVDLTRAHPLVTLVGVGGVGKTRLALHVAAELADEFSDGVWLVELAAVNDVAAVIDTVAGVLGINTRTGGSRAENLANTVSGRTMLIVLDNCEHVLDAAATLTQSLLSRSPALMVLATSRESLGLGFGAGVASAPARGHRWVSVGSG
jgi:hypothetical protein